MGVLDILDGTARRSVTRTGKLATSGDGVTQEVHCQLHGTTASSAQQDTPVAAHGKALATNISAFSDC